MNSFKIEIEYLISIIETTEISISLDLLRFEIKRRKFELVL